MSESPEVRIVLDKTWTRSDLPTDMNVESRGDQFIATVKEEDVVIVVNQFLSKRELGSMVFSHIPPYKPR